MEVIFVVLPLALVLTAVACAAFRWAVNHGQYDDLDTPPLRILIDDAGGLADGRISSRRTGRHVAAEPGIGESPIPVRSSPMPESFDAPIE